jgi:ssDNA-binding Zn-finger/Zn-ribbon topoisomerase 1
MSNATHLREPEPYLVTPTEARRRARAANDQRGLDTFLDVAPCPKCNRPLFVRMGRRGPYFHCACPQSRDA